MVTLHCNLSASFEPKLKTLAVLQNKENKNRKKLRNNNMGSTKSVLGTIHKNLCKQALTREKLFGGAWLYKRKYS